MKNDTPYVGRPRDRVDGRLKVTGEATYAAEFHAPNLAHAVLLQSEPAKAKVLKVDSSEAMKAPGVIAVITSDDLKSFPQAGSSLLSAEIQFSGQNIGVLVAETLEQAQYAATLCKIDYDIQKPQVVMEDQLAEAFIPGAAGRQPVSTRGDAATAMASSPVKVDQIYRTPVEHHNPMEPHATVAVWNDDEHLTAYDSTQGVFGTRGTIARAVGLKEENVRVINPFVGGGFGCKGQSWPHTALAAITAKLVKRPVKIVLTRREMFVSNGHRPETRQALALGAGSDGKLLAIRADMVNHVSRRDQFVEMTGGDSANVYSCPNVSVVHKLVRLDVGAPTYMRAPGESSGSFSIETALDELAVAVNVDPLELRLRNYAERNEERNQPYSSKHLKECYQQGAERFGWERRSPAPRSMRNGGLLVGYGVATATYPANYWGATARARINANGSVLVQCGTQDLGTGTYTILGQIAADALGVSPDVIQVEIGDTSLPNAPVSGGSNSASSAGSAVQAACKSLRESLIGLAGAPLAGMPADALEARDGRVYVKAEPSKGMTYKEILARAGKPMVEQVQTIQPGAERFGPNAHTMQGFGAQFCEVHVDPDSCMMRVARWVGAFAVGTVLNEKTLTSQLRGGIVWGIGMGLLEESLMDPRYGRYTNSNLAEYHVPVNKDVPFIEVVLVPEVDTLVNPLGAKGSGEIGITGAAAAIGNAVYHATGKRVRELPITLDKLL